MLAGDIYDTADYCALETLVTDGEPILIICIDGNDRLAIPLISRKIDPIINGSELLFDAISPYGYAGVITNSQDPQKILDMLEACRLKAAENNIISIFIRLHPINNTFILQDHPLIKQVVHGPTVYIDLSKELDQIRAQYANRMRRDLKKITQGGYYAQINHWEHYEKFISAYHDTMQQHNAAKYYHFNQDYFSTLKKPSLYTHLITVHHESGELASGAIFFGYRDIAQYHLGGTSSKYRKFASSKLVFDTAINYFKGLGFTLLHLGGGVGSKEDALFTFKQEISNQLTTFNSLRIICDENRYNELASAAFERNSIVDPNFFPLYRS